MARKAAKAAKVVWDCATAYDLFVSLDVLHRPADFAVRAAWAAGVRARFPAAARATLESAQMCTLRPLRWVYGLPEPKNGAGVLRALEQLPPAARLPALTVDPQRPAHPSLAFLGAISARGQWTPEDRAALSALLTEAGGKPPSAARLTAALDVWAHPAEFGEQLLEALRAYHEVFFAEEERRIGPALDTALQHAQDVARSMAAPELVEELTQGVRLDEVMHTKTLILAPCYWCTPLVYMDKVGTDAVLYLFGARPAEGSLVPGEVVPDALVRALKALSDPTRLRVLRYLAHETLTPAELSRRLRLRIPTMMHHLQILRLAGLVRISIEGDKDTKHYAARLEEVAAAFSALEALLKGEPGAEP